MIFYGDSFNTDDDDWIGKMTSSTIKLKYNSNYDKVVFEKIYNLFKNDKNVEILVIDIEE